MPISLPHAQLNASDAQLGVAYLLGMQWLLVPYLGGSEAHSS